MRVNLVLNSQPIPSETFLVSWIKLLVAREYKVSLILINSKNNSQHGINFTFEKVRVISKFSFPVIINTLKFIRWGVSLKEMYKCGILSVGSPQIIHFSYSSMAGAFSDAIQKLQCFQIKFVVSCRGTSDNIKPYLDNKRKEKQKLLFKIVDQVHCVSDEMLNRMIRDFDLAASKGYVNRPAININDFKFVKFKNSSVPLIIISTGRLEYVKGYIFAILAIKKLVSLGYNIVYRIVGWGNDLEYLKFIIHRLELTKQVELLGVKESSEVIKEVSSAHLYLSSSLSEGISNAVIEAMAIGVPVISTEVGGMNELVIHNQTGKLVKPFSEDEIFHAILDCLNNWDQLEAIRKNARALVESSFNFERLIEVFDVNYKKLIKNESSPF